MDEESARKPFMKRLEAIMNEEHICLYDVIENAFNQIDRLKIAHCV